MKPDRTAAASLAARIKQSMLETGLLYIDDAIARWAPADITEEMFAALRHGIAHGTNTLGFIERTQERTS